MQNKYRPDIDGFRAIAVLSVVFFHSNIKPFDIDFFSGGYLGVDIFFVISGYLITRIILQELIVNKKKFNFTGFYERRVRRILPALFFIILVSIPFAYYILLPQHLLDYAKSILAATFFFSNIHFIASDYYDFEAILKPLLHTWSLSVEEQFYIFYPFFLVFIFRNFRKYLLSIFIIIIILSILSAQLLGDINPSKNFYILSSRIWELYGGALIAIIQISSIKKKYSNLENFYSILGFSLILTSIIFFDGQTYHPSLYTAIPIVGTILVIYYSHKDYYVTKFLSNKVLTKIGLVSYSFYLWHFIFFSLGKHALIYHDKVSKKYILIILVLSFVSYYLIEKPFRNKKKVLKKNLILILSSLLILLTSSAFYIIKTYDDRNEQLNILNSFIKDQKPKKLFINDKPCFGSKDFCHYKNKDSKKFIFIVGDSVLEGLTADLKPKLIDRGYNVVVMNNSLCHFIPEFNSVIGERQRIASNQICDHKYQDLRLKNILSKPKSIIIMGGFIPFDNFKHYQNKKVLFEDNYKKYVLSLLSKDFKIIQLIDTLNYKKNISELLQRKSFKDSLIDDQKNVKFDFFINIGHEEFLQNHKRQHKLFNSINHKNYMRISNSEFFCNTELKNKCIFNNYKDLYIHDHHHYTQKGSEFVNNKILKIIKKLEMNNN